LKEGGREGKEGVAHLVGEFSGADVLGQEDEAFPDPGLRGPDLRGGKEGGRVGGKEGGREDEGGSIEHWRTSRSTSLGTMVSATTDLRAE